jgi:peptide/nickel transport system substrate-binding protein
MTDIQVTRRVLLTGVGAAALAAGWPKQGDAQTPPNVLVVGHVAELQTLDPGQAVTISDFRILCNIYDSLLHYKDGSLDVEPGLAETWSVSPDGKTYTFNLRKGVKFHDGTAFNAESVKFCFDRVIDPHHPYHDTGPFPFAFILGPIERTEVTAPYTVVLHLKQPYAPGLTALAGAIGSLACLSPAAIKQYGKDFSRNGGGTGPFKFVEWVSGQRFVLEANKDYWRGAPKLAGIVFRPIVDDNARVSEMLSGGTDITIEVPPDDIATFTSNKNFIYYEQPGPHLWYLMLNTREKPFDDVRVRQAANYAINKEAMVTDLLKGSATVANGLTPPAFKWAHDDAIKPYPYDPTKAKQLLAEAGYAKGVDVTFYVTESGSGMLSPILMGTAIQADLAAVGIRAKIETYEWNTFLGKLLPTMPPGVGMAEMSFMTQDPDMHPFLSLRTGAPVNSGSFSDPKVDALIDAGRAEQDQGKRAAIYKQLQQLIYAEAPWVFIANWKQNAVASIHVKGFELHPSFTTRFYETSKA